MKYEIRPVIDVNDLEDALNAQYGPEFVKPGWLASMLFEDSYTNDSYKSFDYSKLEEYTGEPWQDENYVTFMNCVKAFLQDALPDYNEVIIDVSW